MAGHEPVASVFLFRDRAGEILHDRPRGIRAEFEATGIVELLNGADQAHVAVTDQLEEVVRGTDTLLGDRHDQSQIGAEDLVFDGQPSS